MNISKEQLDFLEKEFNLKESDIAKMDIDQWQEIRMKCFDIEVEEICKTEYEPPISDDYIISDADDPISERGLLAVRIADLKYAKLMAPNK